MYTRLYTPFPLLMEFESWKYVAARRPPSFSYIDLPPTATQRISSWQPRGSVRESFPVADPGFS